jgi:uncharacterized protein YndB with AHSA1/START domain
MTSNSTATYDGTIERTPDGGAIRFRRVLPYAVGDVWEAITEPAQLAQWWLPFDADVTVELREGGELRFAGRGEDAPTMTFTILRVEPPTLLEHTHVDEGSYLRWELASVDGGCELLLSHFVNDADQAIDKCYVVGLHASLARLEPLLAGEPAPWDWTEFAHSHEHYAALGLAPAVAS